MTLGEEYTTCTIYSHYSTGHSSMALLYTHHYSPSAIPGDLISSILRIIFTSCVARLICCFLASNVSITCCERMSRRREKGKEGVQREIEEGRGAEKGRERKEGRRQPVEKGGKGKRFGKLAQNNSECSRVDLTCRCLLSLRGWGGRERERRKVLTSKM